MNQIVQLLCSSKFKGVPYHIESMSNSIFTMTLTYWRVTQIAGLMLQSLLIALFVIFRQQFAVTNYNIPLIAITELNRQQRFRVNKEQSHHSACLFGDFIDWVAMPPTLQIHNPQKHKPTKHGCCHRKMARRVY